MIRAWTTSIALAGVITSITGCSAVPSAAVRDLVSRESEKLESIRAESAAIESAAEGYTRRMRTALRNLDDAIENLERTRAGHALILASNRDVDDQRGVDAWATAHHAAMIHLGEATGLAADVRDQFAADFDALEAAAASLTASWDAIAELHAVIHDHAGRTGIASLDDEAIAALVDVTGHTRDLARAVAAASAFDARLDAAIDRFELGDRDVAGRAAMASDDLVDLLERVSAGDGGNDG